MTLSRGYVVLLAPVVACVWILVATWNCCLDPRTQANILNHHAALRLCQEAILSNVKILIGYVKFNCSGKPSNALRYYVAGGNFTGAAMTNMKITAGKSGCSGHYPAPSRLGGAIEATARSSGLTFVPVQDEHYDFAVP